MFEHQSGKKKLAPIPADVNRTKHGNTCCYIVNVGIIPVKATAAPLQMVHQDIIYQFLF